MLSCSGTFHFQSAQRNSGTTVTLYRNYRIKAIKSHLCNKETKMQQANAKLEVPRRMWKHVIAAMHEYCNAPRAKIATNKQKLTANIFTHRSVPAPQDVLVGGLVLFLWTSSTLFAKPFYYLILFLMISRDHSSVLTISNSALCNQTQLEQSLIWCFVFGNISCWKMSSNNKS